MKKLGTRVFREKQAYDCGRVLENSARMHKRFRHVFSCPNTLRGETYFSSVLKKSCANSSVLDFGCYNGHLSRKMLEFKPTKIAGIDISEKGVREGRACSPNSILFMVMDCQKLGFPDDTFDFVVGRAILHHLDLNSAIGEIHRVLKPGGKALFYEPLGDNPGAKLFRFLTPKARTLDERPLSRKDILFADQIFNKNCHLAINFFSTLAGMCTSFLPVKSDNFLLRVADWADQKMVNTIFKYWMRQVVLVWEK